MRWIVAISLRFRYIVVALGVAMMIFGGGVLRDTPVDVFPEFAQPKVEIQTYSLGLSAEEVESLVTVPLEQSLQGLPQLDTVRSKSVPALSSIVLLFDRGTDLLHTRQLVQERVEAVTPTLPTWASPPVMIQPLSSTSRVMKIGLTSDRLSLIEMSTIAYWKIRARLLRVPGVANVPIWGERLQQMHVQVDPKKLQENGVSLLRVMDDTSNALDAGLLQFSEGHVIGTGGFVDTPNQRINVRNVLPIITPDDLAKVPLHVDGSGKDVKIGDVARVVEDHQPLIGDAVINDSPGLLLVVEKLPWANTVEMTKGVEEAIRSLEPGLPGVQFDTTIFQQANFITASIHNLTEALVLGFVLVIVILALFLFEWRVALISVLTIPLSLMTTLLVLYWRGETINTMTLAGLVIALGAVVDDAIIDVENIVRRLRQHRLSGGEGSTSSVILNASLEVRGPIVYATLIIVAAIVPVFLLQGLTGAFFRPLALSYTLAIVASLLVALTVTPALALILLARSKIERRTSPVVAGLQRGYTAALSRIVVRPRRAYAIFALVTVVGIALTPLLGQSLFPGFKERDFLVHWVSQPGTSADEMRRTTLAVSKELRQIPGVRNFGAHIGQAFLGEEVAGVNLGENWISIDPSVDYDSTLDRIEDVNDAYAGLFRETQTYLDERIEEVISGGKEPIVVRVFGENLSVLREKAAEIDELMGTIEGVQDQHTDVSTDVPQLQVEVDLAKTEKYGLKPGDVRRAAATLVAGEEVGDIFRGGKAYDVVVWSTPQTRTSVPAIQNLRIVTPSGNTMRLADVADVSLQPSPNAIDREGDSRRLDVEATFEGDLGSVVEQLQEKLKGVHFDQGYHAEILGEWQERESAQRTLLITAVIAGAAILLLLQASFGSWRLALLSFLTLPMALVGGIIGAFLGGGVVSLGSLVGFFTVFGIAARNGILLINHFQHLEREEGMTFGRDLVLRGARERLSPILMTSLATGLALIPLVIFGERPGQEIEHPLAIVIVGGLVTSTLLNLFVTPSLYLRFGKSRRDTDLPAAESETQTA